MARRQIEKEPQTAAIPDTIPPAYGGNIEPAAQTTAGPPAAVIPQAAGKVAVTFPVFRGTLRCPSIGNGIPKIEARFGTCAVGEAFLRVEHALRQDNAKLANGRPVYSHADVMRWVFEQVAEHIAAS
jgi:hypothetical protein